MKKFLALYMMSIPEMDRMIQNATPEQREEMNKTWSDWMEKNKKHFADKGAPLGKNKRITSSEITDTRNEVGGYTIIQAESQEDAAKIMQTSPDIDKPGTYVDIMEIVEM